MDSVFFDDLNHLLFGQSLGVLATYLDPHPYPSLVGFAVSDDLSEIYFTTPRSTRKYDNLRAHPKTALLIDSRTHHPDDFFKAAAVSVIGAAGECSPETGDQAKRVFLARHPQLTEFVNAETSAMMCLRVEKYILVRRFQDVAEWSP